MQINRTYKHKSCTQPVWWNAECQKSKPAKYEKLSELRKDHSERNKKYRPKKTSKSCVKPEKNTTERNN